MTAEEALDVLKNNLVIALHDFVYSAYIKGDDTEYEQEQVESLKTAIFALKKQIPRKPMPSEKQHVRYAMCFTCPSCGRDFSGTGIADYCYHCGQALDWSDTE